LQCHGTNDPITSGTSPLPRRGACGQPEDGSGRAGRGGRRYLRQVFVIGAGVAGLQAIATRA